MQLDMDSKHRVTNLKFSITILGLIDVGMLFRLFSLVVSNKKDSTMYKKLVHRPMELFDPQEFKSQIVWILWDCCTKILSASQKVF